MTKTTLVLPGPIALVPSAKVSERLARTRSRNSGPVDLVAAVAEMSQLAQAGGLPARVDGEWLVVYTQRFEASLHVTQYGDAYRLGRLEPLTFRGQERLLSRALLLSCPGGWHIYHRVTDLPANLTAHWESIQAAWHAPSPEGPSRQLPQQHAEYLDDLVAVIEASRKIELERQRAEPALPYRQVGSTREERHSGRGVYEFELLRPARLSSGTPVYLVDAPDLRGRVVRIQERQVVVRFDTNVDFPRIPRQGALQVLPSERVFQAQLEAVEALRQGRVSNPHLLINLAEGRLLKYHPETIAAPDQPLDPGQLVAFRRALAIQDQLLVLGPPGTGKTRTITEIAAACAKLRQRVLVTSHTNRAVDNVLERLPAQIRAVRVGNEDSMTGIARTFMLETQVNGLIREILAATASSASRLATFTAPDLPIVRWLQHLRTQLGRARDADAEAQQHQGALQVHVRRAHPSLAALVTSADKALARAGRRLSDAERRVQAAHLPDAEQHRELFGFLVAWWGQRRAQRLDRLRQVVVAARLDLAAAQSEHMRVQADAEHALVGDLEAAPLCAARDAAHSARGAALDEVRRAAETVQAVLRAALLDPGDVSPGGPDELAEWQRHLNALDEAVGLAERRARLLQDWRARVQQPGEDLARETLRFADVVAATCIGTASSPLLADLDFDLAIVDEAGQIAAPTLLVPLVRARRCVLVGDHQQLPPFLDDEVKGWVEELKRSHTDLPARTERISNLLIRSAFELLYRRVHHDHRVMLTVQRRMPEQLASFVSGAFYSGALQTEHPGGTTDPIFREPFAFIDTADRPVTERSERPGRRGEEWGQAGYVNPLEARLIADLVTQYTAWYPSWAVIVPYRAQVDLIRQLLTGALGDASHVTDNVGTVDSFQGGERDLIVYGFTRSNPHGNVGFLAELRRLNVAITRARRQLIVIGDSSTLRRARTETFAALFRRMLDHLSHSGDVRSSRDVQDDLKRLAGQRS